MVILFDGFRWDYIQDIPDLPGFQWIKENGVKADYLQPAFPTTSYPNYYSLMTGTFALFYFFTCPGLIERLFI